MVTTTRERVIAYVEQLPEQFEFNELIEQLYLLHRSEIARQRFAEGKYVAHDELKERIARGEF